LVQVFGIGCLGLEMEIQLLVQFGFYLLLLIMHCTFGCFFERLGEIERETIPIEK
jgi:hypothetical protein